MSESLFRSEPCAIPEDYRDLFFEFFLSKSQKYNFVIKEEGDKITAIPDDSGISPVQLECHLISFPTVQTMEGSITDENPWGNLEFIDKGETGIQPRITILPSQEGHYSGSPSLDKCFLEHHIAGTFRQKEFCGGIFSKRD